MKIVTVVWATLQAIVCIGLMLVSPLMFAQASYVTTVIFAQLISIAVVVVGIALLFTKKWLALQWLMIVALTYTVLDLGWRLGADNTVSAIILTALMAGWQVLALITAIKSRSSPHFTS